MIHVGKKIQLFFTICNSSFHPHSSANAQTKPPGISLPAGFDLKQSFFQEQYLYALLMPSTLRITPVI